LQWSSEPVLPIQIAGSNIIWLADAIFAHNHCCLLRNQTMITKNCKSSSQSSTSILFHSTTVLRETVRTSHHYRLLCVRIPEYGL
jgi:hypothetical protein